MPFDSAICKTKFIEEECLEVSKECTGCSQSPKETSSSPISSPPICNGSEDKKKSESLPGTPTGKSLCNSKGKSVLEELRPSSEPPVTPNYRVPPLPKNMCGRKTPESPTPSSRYAFCEVCRTDFDDYCGEYYFICDECICDPMFQ